MVETNTVMDKAKHLLRYTVGTAFSPVHSIVDVVGKKTDAPSTINVTSKTFLANGPIPRANTPMGANTSIELSWTGVPSAAKELALLIEDPDAPFPKPFVHWVLWGVSPTTTSLPAGLPTTPTLPSLGVAKQGTNDFKKHGYGGPQPPLGHGVHHYHVQLFALDTTLSLQPGASRDDLATALKGHVLAEGELVGTYEQTE